MNGLDIPSHLLAEIHRHAVETYPEECCGVLIGEGGPENKQRVEELLPAENQREAEHRHNRFLIPPGTILKAQRGARERGLDIVGYYHSHPDHPAVPSDFDREHAWPGTSYVIVSVRTGEARETRSWRLADSRERFDEERLEIVEAARKEPKR